VPQAVQYALDLHTDTFKIIQTDTHSPDGISTQATDVTQMYKNSRYWTIGLVVLGGISILSGSCQSMNPYIGALLVVIGTSSLKLRIPVMYVIFSVILAFVAIPLGLRKITFGFVELVNSL
jgi:hypothetical protein